MEIQNDHKKSLKKIWILSAGIIVVLAIVLFAGIKNGFFLRKSDKILYAMYQTVKDQPQVADGLNGEDYTISIEGQWKKQKIQAEYASDSAQKQLRGTLDLDKLQDLEFVMVLNDKELKAQFPSLSSKVFTYDYNSNKQSGYIAKKIGSQNLERFNTVLAGLYGGKEQKEIGKDILKEARKEFNKIKINKIEKQEFEIDGQKKDCVGYQFVISSDNVQNVLDAAEKAAKKKYGDGTKISEDPAGKIFMAVYDKVSAAGEMECKVYLFRNKLAAIAVNYEIDGNKQNMEILFSGGDFRMQNMKITYLKGEETHSVRTAITGNPAAGDGTLTFESDGEDGLNGRISVKKGSEMTDITGEECDLMGLNGFELLGLFGEFAGF
jgi:hypothetical protein